MFDKIFKHKIINCDEKVSVIGINKKVQASYVWNLFCVSKKSILVVTNTLFDANNLYKSLLTYKEDVLFFPMDDFIVSEALAISPDLMSKRIETLNNLVSNKKPNILIVNLMGYLRFLPNIDVWKDLNVIIKKNDTIKREDLIRKLDMIGYEKTSLVTKTGEYANRGYILDIFPYGMEDAIRIEFFDDLVEEIRVFDVNSQLSQNKTDELEIFPITEFINERNIDEIDKRQSLLPRVCKSPLSSIRNYLEDNLTVFIDYSDINNGYKSIMNEVISFKETDKYDIDKYMFDLSDLTPNKYVDLLTTSNYVLDGLKEIYFTKEIEKFKGNYNLINSFINTIKKENKTIIFLLDDQRIIDELNNKLNIKMVITNYNNLSNDYINIINDKMPNGFIIDNYAFITKNELFSEKEIVKYRSKYRYGTKIKDINKLEIGDYVVHSSFGIGRYLGIQTLTLKGITNDYLYIEYKDNDKLYIPASKIEYISKYSSNEGITPRLSKLGGTDWIKQKTRVKTKVKDIAKDLLIMSARRKLEKGFAFLDDDKQQYEFEKNFEYEETNDQLKAIKEIKEDMMLPYPMDRLLCGDVGYGKTEVAFRAAFKAIESGKQVAFLCPTTILSNQHYENAKERFKGFGINITVLNRYITQSMFLKIIKDIENGKIDLIIGTHKLLNKNIKYKDLGLLIIDEEQRFGVTHKEKIKSLKQNIDVLTLSATPIPRTLQMSLSGLRGLSLIETPPKFRYPVQTYVLEENESVVKDAIYKELARNGGVFVLYNVVSNMEEKVNYIRSLVPEALVGYVNGKMSKDEIESTMESFINNEINVLVCTTIIETGIDIPNTNTLIIYDADHFGLSQLYQIRGRIGRGKNIGYAYLMYKKNKELNDVAKKRLDAIKEFTELGSGYQLALRDLSIRGAGNILGSEQSGFIDAIGYDMYIKILNEEIAKLKNDKAEKVDEEVINDRPLLNVSSYVNDKYANTQDIKIEIHKLINSIMTIEDLNSVKMQLQDRFGYLDDDLIIYMYEELFEVLARKKDVIKVDELPNKIVLYFSKDKSKSINAIDVLSNIYKISGNFSVNYSKDILKVILDKNNLDKHYIYYLVEMLNVFE